jgi:hypothetical protein
MGLLKKALKVAVSPVTLLPKNARAPVAAAVALYASGGNPAAAMQAAATVRGLQQQHSANKTAKSVAVGQMAALQEQTASAEKMAKDQQMQQEKALQKISLGRVKSAKRRVRGGLFGDVAGSDSQYAAGAKLGG